MYGDWGLQYMGRIAPGGTIGSNGSPSTVPIMSRLVITAYPIKPPACVEYDPRVVEVAHEIMQMISAALPPVTVEHIGSTSVPGCAGKGIIDLMVLYPDGQ